MEKLLLSLFGSSTISNCILILTLTGKCSSHCSWRKFLFAVVTITETHNWSNCTEQVIMGCLTSVTQTQHVRLREHNRKWRGKIKAQRPRTSAVRQCLLCITEKLHPWNLNSKGEISWDPPQWRATCCWERDNQSSPGTSPVVGYPNPEATFKHIYKWATLNGHSRLYSYIHI